MDNELIRKCKGGGSIIDKQPVLAPNGLCLIIPWRSVLRSFSIETGERITDYDGIEDNIIAAAFNPNNAKLLMACSCEGDIICWKWETEILVSRKKLDISFDKINTFHVFALQDRQGDEVCEIIVSWSWKGENQVGFFTSKNAKLKRNLNIRIQSKNYRLDVGGKWKNSFVAVIEHNKLMCRNIKEDKFIKYKIGHGNTFSCVRCHPEIECVATGDTLGRVLLWQGLFDGKGPTKAIYHWHTLPVRTIVFSNTGANLFSGGDECVLVKWDLENPHKKDFLPRLPAPIAHLVISPDNLNIAVSTVDNGILMLDTHLRLKCIIQQMVWGSQFPAGMHYDSYSKALVLNGKPGHLQFYSPHEMNLLYNLDVVNQNKITRERNIVIANTIVEKISLSKNCIWLATVECRSELGIIQESRLKFWKFDSKLQNYKLDTNVEMPHEGGISAVCFQPADMEQAVCATAGLDHYFKIWSSPRNENTCGWTCSHVGYHKGQPVTALDFSPDGSVMAVGFDSCLTLWIPDTCQLRASLVHPEYRNTLRDVHFGNADHSHLVICATDKYICVWNLLTLGLVWTVSVEFAFMCKDPTTTYLATITNSDTLIIFEATSSKPIFVKKKICGDTARAICGTWVPHCNSQSEPTWQKNSQLYLMTSNQELICLETRGNSSLINKEEFIPQAELSSFGILVADKTTRQVIQPTNIKKSMNTKSATLHTITFKQLLAPPIHAIAPMRILCRSVLQSTLQNCHQAGRIENGSLLGEGTKEHDSRKQENCMKKRPLKLNYEDNDNVEEVDLQSTFIESTTWASILV